MRLQNNFTTPEQSKQLLELGIPKGTADCVYIIYQKDNNEDYYTLNVPLPHQSPITDIVEKGNADYKDGNVKFCYCWSVGRLIEIYGFGTNQHIGNIWYRNPMECIIADIEIAIENGEMDFSKLRE
jgi:hypothetical protein